MRPVIVLLVLAFLTSTVHAQQAKPNPKPKTPSKADSARWMFWKHKGGGGGGVNKASPALFISSTLDTVQYIAATRTIIIKSHKGIGKKYDKMMEELERTPQRTDQMMVAVSKVMPKTVVPYYARPMKAAFEQVQHDLAGAVVNKIELPDYDVFQPQAVSASDLDNSSTSGPNINESGSYSDSLDIKSLKPMADVLSYYETHKNDIITSVPVPPQNQYTYCAPCDTAAEALFQQQYESFRKEFLGEDERIMHLVWAMMREASLVFTEAQSDEVYNLSYPIMKWVLDRADKKARLLVQEYMDDPSRVRTVTMLGLSIDRTQQLLGLSKEDGFYMDAFMRGQLALVKLIEKAIKEYDYSIALNINMMFSVERQFQLLGSDSQRMNLIDMLNFNQFKMNIDLSGKISGDGAYQVAHVKGDNWFSAVPGKDCKLVWILMGPDKKWLKTELLEADIRGNGGQIKYAGTKDWQAAPPLMRIDFCGADKKDTAELYAFQAANSQELWTYPRLGTIRSAHMNVVLTNCFIDVERAKQTAAHFKNDGNLEKMKQQMQQQYETFMKNGGKEMMNKNAAQMTPQDIQKMMQLSQSMDAAKKITEMVQSPNLASYLLLPVVHNKDKVVFRQSLNGKEVFPANRATEYAMLHVTLEQDPNSPYKGVGILDK